MLISNINTKFNSSVNFGTRKNKPIALKNYFTYTPKNCYNNNGDVFFCKQCDMKQDLNKDTNKQKLLAERFAGLDLSYMADQFAKYKIINTGGELIEFQEKDKDKIHIAIFDSQSDEEYTHYYYNKQEFLDLLNMIKTIVESEYPEFIDNCDVFVKTLSKAL